jgi:hypothetical protein
MLMVGVTLAMGSMVAVAALGQFGLSNGSAAQNAALMQSASGVDLGLVFVSVLPSESCPQFMGYNEGATITVSIYNYGTSAFTPSEFMDNSSAFHGTYSTTPPGSLGDYTLNLGKCTHSAGQTLLVLDSTGEGFQAVS